MIDEKELIERQRRAVDDCLANAKRLGITRAQICEKMNLTQKQFKNYKFRGTLLDNQHRMIMFMRATECFEPAKVIYDLASGGALSSLADNLIEIRAKAADIHDRAYGAIECL